jgi:hypothetical protein
MANARKRKARQARRAVERTERVQATPETLAKLRPHPMEVLLAKGRDGSGIDADQWQSACEITDAFDALTRQLGLTSANLQVMSRSPPSTAMSAREERLSVIWLAWSPELIRRRLSRPHVVYEWIIGRRPLGPRAVWLLSRALDLWGKVRHDTQPKREVSTIRRGDALDIAAAMR